MDRAVTTATDPRATRPVFRFFAGLLLTGERFELELVPSVDGCISVRVRGMPTATGLREACMMGDSEARRSYHRSEIEVGDSMLSCMAGDRLVVPSRLYREGFSVAISPEQARVLRAELPRLELVAVIAMAIAGRLRQILPAPLEHKLDFAANIAARVVLDAVTPADALRMEATLHFAGKDSPFCAAFGDPEIVQILLDASRHQAGAVAI